jgi:hypothetical protein
MKFPQNKKNNDTMRSWTLPRIARQLERSESTFTAGKKVIILDNVPKLIIGQVR